MKKWKKLARTLALTLALASAFSANALAYDYETDPINNEGSFIVDNFVNPKRPAVVVLYEYVPEAYANDMNRASIEFGFFGEDDTYNVYDRQSIVFEYQMANKKAYDTLPHGQVISWQFTVEPGLYQFATDTDSFVLKKDFTIISNDEMNSLNEDGTLNLSDESVWLATEDAPTRIYGVFGRDYGAKNIEDYAEFVEWAKNADAGFAAEAAEMLKTPDEIANEEPDEVVAVKSSLDNSENASEEVAIEETVVEEEKPEIPTVEETGTVSDQTQQEKIPVKTWIIGIVCLAILAFLGFGVSKLRK